MLWYVVLVLWLTGAVSNGSPWIVKADNLETKSRL